MRQQTNIGHRLTLFLDHRLYHSIMRACVQSRLSPIFQTLTYLIEGLYRDGYLDSELYYEFKERYSQSLFEVEARPAENLSSEELKLRRATYRQVLTEIDKYVKNEGWRQAWKRRAEADSNKFPEARMVLEKILQFETMETEIEILNKGEKEESRVEKNAEG